MEKILKLDILVSEDYYEDEYRQEICDDNNDIYFSVHNLTECPEDATVYRNLFNADDYIRALNKGIELAKKGYTKIEGNRIKDEEE